jgi:hypothetical protein
MYYIQCNNKYALHIGFICYLLKLDVVIITDSSNIALDMKNDVEYRTYYQKVLDILYKESNMYMCLEFVQYYILGNCNFESQTSSTISFSITQSSLTLSESELYENLISLNIISDANIYTNEILPRPTFMNWIYTNYLQRSITQPEISFWQMNCVAHKVNVCCFILICIFKKEGMMLSLHVPFYNAIKEAKYIVSGIPNIAVIFHSYSRYYLERYNSHHKYIVDNPYFDIFIHTWNDRGHKYEFQLEKINASGIQMLYKTKNFATEDIWSKLKPTFTLVGKMYPIFLQNDQDKGDATQYINAKLYSIQQAFNLMKAYEIANGFSYTGVIKLGFDLNITAIDMKKIVDDIKKNYIYFRDGCSTCDKEIHDIPKNHSDHTDPLDLTWYYGNRSVMEIALNLYDNAFSIAQSFQARNIANISNVAHRQRLDFVYVYKPEINNVWTIINRQIFCYVPQRLMREQLKNYRCKTSKAIGCEILKPAVFENNL